MYAVCRQAELDYMHPINVCACHEECFVFTGHLHFDMPELTVFLATSKTRSVMLYLSTQHRHRMCHKAGPTEAFTNEIPCSELCEEWNSRTVNEQCTSYGKLNISDERNSLLLFSSCLPFVCLQKNLLSWQISLLFVLHHINIYTHKIYNILIHQSLSQQTPIAVGKQE